jgi:hypothetical protein
VSSLQLGLADCQIASLALRARERCCIELTMRDVLDKVAVEVRAGLTLTAAGARHDVLRRSIVSWVRLADEEREPFRAWLAGVVAHDAEKRAEYLALLIERAARTGRRGAWAARDLARERGAPTELERELRLLRKEGKGRQARLDARKLERELQSRFDAGANGVVGGEHGQQ